MKKQRSLSDLTFLGSDECLGIPQEGLRRSASSRLRRMLDRPTTQANGGAPNFLSGLLQEHMLQVSAPLVRPAPPQVIEPHSSSSEEEVPEPAPVATDDYYLPLPRSSNGNAKSAAGTPLEDSSDGRSLTVDACDAAGPELSPSHAFNKSDRHAIKQLSSSTPAMTHAQQLSRSPMETPSLGGRGPGDAPDPRAPTNTPPSPQLIAAPGSSKARQKKFHRHFKQVAVEERVLNYYSCALVGDILLQGHLYITKNYFAFYSNVFGYVTKLLIPTVDVLKVSKEKTAKIIPNAVGISTEDEKHVFGSLLSRDATYKLMVQVWKAATNPVVELKAPVVLKHDVEDSASGEQLLDDESSGSGSGNEARLRTTASLPVVANPETFQKLLPSVRKGAGGSISIPLVPKTTERRGEWWQSSAVLTISMILVVALSISASVLIYRVSLIQDSFKDFPSILESDDVYSEIIKWQSQLHSRSSQEVHEFVNTNLNQIAKVRLSLEALSMLIVTNDRPYDRRGTSQSCEGDTTRPSPPHPEPPDS